MQPTSEYFRQLKNRKLEVVLGDLSPKKSLPKNPLQKIYIHTTWAKIAQNHLSILENIIYFRKYHLFGIKFACFIIN
ncbi:MAG: hypothetical protein KAI83_02595 [Thiomargarita sp.]|nr:hypothetical protein [Thiomargarita sp.]